MTTRPASHRGRGRTLMLTGMATEIYNRTGRRIMFDLAGHGIDPGRWLAGDTADPITAALIRAGRLKRRTAPAPKPDPVAVAADFAPEPDRVEAGPVLETPPVVKTGHKKEKS